MWYVFAAPLLHCTGAAVGIVVARVGSLPILQSLVAGEAAVWLCALVALAMKKGSVRDAAVSLVEWHWYSVAAGIGILRRPRNPMVPVEGREMA